MTPKVLLESGFQQSVKGGGARKFNIGRLWPRYRRAFDKFDQVLGRDQVSLWKFDPASFPNKDVVTDFCQRLNLTLPTSDIIRANESLSLEAVSLLYIFRRFKLDTKAVNYGEFRQIKRLVKKVSTLPGTPLKFREAMVRPVFDAFQHDTDWIEKRLGTSVSEIGPDAEWAIRSEEDLLRPNRAAIDWLTRQIGVPTPEPAEYPVPAEQIAEWMDTLRLSLGTEKALRRDANPVNERLKRRLERESRRMKRDANGEDDPTQNESETP